ncbi:DNA replication checkpoint protein tel2 [Golovinomyces cichoracearum]|uniref:DNA replication checkpoint protein tel2 n=1 Tax=Golovinomyces cichoracearum TaxID=62708 RepID=A0A420HFC7_9PEZI|nr:DNA replication checkpoint protein tel2 [Golovinomyces cichoracearum]
MDGQLTQVSSISYKSLRNSPNGSLGSVSKSTNLVIPIATPEEALEALRNEPDYQVLISALRQISQQSSNFDISSPHPVSAQLVHVLISEIVPSFWEVLSRSTNKCPPALRLLVSCLQNVTSLNSVILHLKKFTQQSKDLTSAATQGLSIQEYLKIYLNLLEVVLRDDEIIEKIWKDTIKKTGSPVELRILWKEVLVTIGSGKIVGIASEAETVLRNLSKHVIHKHWVTDGRQYSLWLARNITRLSGNVSMISEVEWKCCGDLMSKALSLGYSDCVVKEVITTLLLQEENRSSQFSRLCANLSSSDLRKIVNSTLSICSKLELHSNSAINEDQWWKSDIASVSALAALISAVISENEEAKNHLITWLTNDSGAGITNGVRLRRSVIAALIKDKCCIESIFEKCLENFSDVLYIRHTSSLQQEVQCQVLLLAAGYLHRQSPLRLRMTMKSGGNLSVVSNRLSMSSARARFLGMVVGEALSSVVDKPENQLDFKIDEMKTSEAKWYKSLLEVSDSVGSLDHLKFLEEIQEQNISKKSDNNQSTKLQHSLLSTSTKIKFIEDINATRENLINDGLESYSKPDSDPEDSDDDPTLVNRNKVLAPVYIRDLISYLRNTDSYDHQKLGLFTAASLIQRKANFGTEVSDHAEELATILVGIQDKYNIENFSSMRLEGMITILVALPSKMGQWFSNTFFEGDYSISQRSSILTALGLSAREIGGLGSLDKHSLLQNQSMKASFPSKTLPPSMEKYYLPEDSTKVDILSNQLEKDIIKPMANSLANKLSGPSVLKIRLFSSRPEVEKNRPKPKVNGLSKIAGDYFFFPLARRFSLYFNSHTASNRSIIFQPFLLSHFIKTLTLILHAAGPYSPSLPQTTTEFWDLLLGLRVTAREERIVCEALCFAFLTLLELNSEKKEFVQGHGKQLLETQGWIRLIFEALGDGDEDERCKVLAAGCIVRIQEIVETYQKTLLGTL